MRIPQECPLPILNFEVGALRAEDIIAMKKLNLIHHIASLEDNSLAKEIFSVQNEMNLPGLVSECKEIIENLNLPNIIEQDVRDQWSKQRWKAITKKPHKKHCFVQCPMPAQNRARFPHISFLCFVIAISF